VFDKRAPLRSEIERWEQLFLNLEAAQDHDMSEKDKRRFLIRQFFVISTVPTTVTFSIRVSMNDPNNKYFDIIENLKRMTDLFPDENNHEVEPDEVEPANPKERNKKKGCIEFQNGNCNCQRR
jgi:hypothetical protein